ncbi:ABC transporter substrate-binding protein [Virgibacillus necropolis]|uniref:Ferrichrome ABC transporter substrate-binding protein n=1 Tax=Virgibacillus necropolis TaxID=163877 RepID=A0A221ME69_9BACI|nr:iron-siderophore ABC transporter substrate-binding protein [Virgibacillus necropolis]ASN05963.1 ferrichrome ABC transporter substrate-binding protein [Virgibacillus necropolis]
MKKAIILACILVLTLLAACNDPSKEDTKSKDENTTDREIKIEDAMGTQTIKGTPKNIVVLEWSYAEDLLALGIQPTGVADLDGYNKWINVDEKLAKSVKDVGTRQEPNLEAISRLNPDLIIAVKYRHEDILDNLKDIAPVVTFAPYSEEATKNQYKNMKEEFKKVATIVDKTEEAELAISDLEGFIDDQAKRVKDAGLEGSKYIATQAYSAQNTPIIRMFTGNSIVSQIMERLSFENAYESDKLEPYGYSEVTIEALQNFQEEELQFLYIVQEDDNIFENQLKGNPVWENLSFVKNGNTHQLPGDTWTFGGILSAHVLTEQLVDAMVEE